MEEKEVFINDLKVNFKVAGQGPAILVLHGWGGSSDSWINFQRIVANNGYKVICPDFPGFGKSITQKAVWNLNDYVDWLNSFIRSQELESFVLIGHSFGGRVGVKFVNSFSEKVKALVLCDSAGIKREPDLKTKLIFIASRLGNSLFSPRALRRFKDKARNFFYLFLRQRDYVKAKGIMKESIKKIFNEDTLPFLKQIDKRTLIVWGKKDKIVPLADAFVFRDNIAGSELAIIDKAGHSPHLEVPEKLASIVLDFLKKI